jgi:hypothetical protein
VKSATDEMTGQPRQMCTDDAQRGVGVDHVHAACWLTACLRSWSHMIHPPWYIWFHMPPAYLDGKLPPPLLNAEAHVAVSDIQGPLECHLRRMEEEVQKAAEASVLTCDGADHVPDFPADAERGHAT